MEGVSVAQSAKAKKTPKVLEEIRTRRGMDGNIVATHHYAGYEHNPKSHDVEPTKEAIGAHFAKHMSLEEQGGSEPEPHWTKEKA